MSDSADKDPFGPGAKGPRARTAAETGSTDSDDDAAATGPTDPHPDVAGALKNFADAYAAAAAKGGATPEITDAVSQALVMILGSGPSLAAYQGLLQSQQANGQMYHNAVANQQKTNILGMAMTAKCVRYMLDGDAGGLDDEILSEMTA
jgi:hypothetical protein